MKEVIKWDNKPRWMWCWDNDERDVRKGYVVYILSEEEMNATCTSYPVIMVGSSFKHCAEIIEEETTRLTCYELSQLLKCFGVEWCPKNTYIHNDISYECKDANEEVHTDFQIRYKQGEWEEPTRETVLKWWSRESSDSDISRFVSFFGWGEDKE